MECKLCAELRDQYLLEAQKEAEATLRQRLASVQGTYAKDQADYNRLQQQVRECRMRQARLTSMLEKHIMGGHPAEESAMASGW